MQQSGRSYKREQSHTVFNKKTNRKNPKSTNLILED